MSLYYIGKVVNAGPGFLYLYIPSCELIELVLPVCLFARTLRQLMQLSFVCFLRKETLLLNLRKIFDFYNIIIAYQQFELYFALYDIPILEISNFKVMRQVHCQVLAFKRCKKKTSVFVLHLNSQQVFVPHLHSQKFTNMSCSICFTNEFTN